MYLVSFPSVVIFHSVIYTKYDEINAIVSKQKCITQVYSPPHLTWKINR